MHTPSFAATTARRIGLGLGILVLLVWLAWTVGSVLFSNLKPAELRLGVTGAYVAWLLAAVLWIKPVGRALAAVLVSAALVTAAYLLTPPRHDRDWQPTDEVAATVQVDGDRVTVHGVRNFHYRSVDDFDERWEDREYDLSLLRTLDVFLNYWGGSGAVCHPIVSFGFEGGEQLAVSVEARKEVGERYSTAGGLFKRFELVYVFADERDVIGVRAMHRGEDVYLYRLRADPRRLRELFLSYVRFANGLTREPEFYHLLKNSCGVNVLHRVAETGLVPWSGREALFSGHWDLLLYDRGALDRSLPFAELRERSRVNARARETEVGLEFSELLREGLPAAPPLQGAGG